MGGARVAVAQLLRAEQLALQDPLQSAVLNAPLLCNHRFDRARKQDLGTPPPPPSQVLDEELLDDTDAADAPWAWEDGAAAGAAAAGAAVDSASAEEDAILAQLAAIDFEALKDEDAEQRELAAMVVDALGDDLELVAAAEEGPEVADAQGLSAVRGWRVGGVYGGADRRWGRQEVE
jgi:hypothetical protein